MLKAGLWLLTVRLVIKIVIVFQVIANRIRMRAECFVPLPPQWEEQLRQDILHFLLLARRFVLLVDRVFVVAGLQFSMPDPRQPVVVNKLV